MLDPGLRDFNLDIRSAQQLEPEDVLSLCTTLPMMADRRVVVVRDVEAWKRKTRGKKAVLEYLQKPIPETLLVLVQGAASEAKDDKPDTDLAKHAYTIAFAELTVEEATRWVAREAKAMGITFAPGAEAHLLQDGRHRPRRPPLRTPEAPRPGRRGPRHPRAARATWSACATARPRTTGGTPS